MKSSVRATGHASVSERAQRFLLPRTNPLLRFPSRSRTARFTYATTGGTERRPCLFLSKFFQYRTYLGGTRRYVRHAHFDAQAILATQLEILSRLHQVDDFRGVDRRIRDELQDQRFRSGVDARDAEGLRCDAQAVGFQQAFRRFGWQAEAIDQFFLHGLQVFERLAIGKAFVQYQAFVDVGAIIFRQQGRRVQVDFRPEIEIARKFRLLAGLQRLDRGVQHFSV